MELGIGNVKGISKDFIVLVQSYCQSCSQASDTLHEISPLMLVDTGKRKEHNVGRGFFGIVKLQYHMGNCVAGNCYISSMHFILEMDYSVATQ